jgi:hypothetical protein
MGFWSGFGFIGDRVYLASYSYIRQRFLHEPPGSEYAKPLRCRSALRTGLHNGQKPTGAIRTAPRRRMGVVHIGRGLLSSGPRNPDATVVIPTENEWYKGRLTTTRPNCPYTDLLEQFSMSSDAYRSTESLRDVRPGGVSRERPRLRTETIPNSTQSHRPCGPAPFTRAGTSDTAATPERGVSKIALIPEPSTGLLVIAGCSASDTETSEPLARHCNWRGYAAHRDASSLRAAALIVDFSTA